MEEDGFKAFLEQSQLCIDIGFDWDNKERIITQIRKELAEVEEALTNNESSERIQEELGDVIHACCWLIRYLGFDPNETLANASAKAIQRTQMVGQVFKEQKFDAKNSNDFEQKLLYWKQVKETLSKK
jgi:uncharacterized protein YabN with tetrapyrrole methylase and pyrophosphatase domain